MRTCFSEDGHETIPRILAKGKDPAIISWIFESITPRILLESGIIPEHLTISNVCTCENSDELFFTSGHRWKARQSGRFPHADMRHTVC